MYLASCAGDRSALRVWGSFESAAYIGRIGENRGLHQSLLQESQQRAGQAVGG
jgi:hypothetical protein